MRLDSPTRGGLVMLAEGGSKSAILEKLKHDPRFAMPQERRRFLADLIRIGEFVDLTGSDIDRLPV